MYRMRSRGVLASRFRHRCQTGTIDTSFATKLRRTRPRAIHGSPWSRTNNGTSLNLETKVFNKNRLINRVYLFSSTKSMIKRKKKKNSMHTHFQSMKNLPRSFQFACCGINGSSNYGTSWWRLQEVGRRELVVPLSCCTLNNVNQTDSFLNPEPANLTFCQALNPAEHQYARHTTVRIINEDVVKRVRKK